MSARADLSECRVVRSRAALAIGVYCAVYRGMVASPQYRQRWRNAAGWRHDFAKGQKVAS
jgi:hypothetical protein